MDYFAATTATYTSSTTNHPDKLKKKKKKNNNNNKGLTTTTNNGAHYCCKLSTDPQSVAARERRHRISNRFKTLQSLVPGGSKMDTVSMLEQAINYVKFLKSQILIHQTLVNHTNTNTHTHAQLVLDQYRNQGGLLHYNHDPAPAASFYFTGHPTTFDSGSPDLGGTSADSYCSHPGACSAQPAGGSQLMFPAPEYFVGHGGEDGMRYL